VSVTRWDGVSTLLCRRVGMPVSAKGDIYNRLADCARTSCETFEHMGTILLIIVVLLLIGALPHWPYSSGWGYYPSGGLGLVLLILIILLVLRYI
jgi:NhaP-type Na+/H+ or K+/H+ antiporter